MREKWFENTTETTQNYNETIYWTTKAVNRDIVSPSMTSFEPRSISMGVTFKNSIINRDVDSLSYSIVYLLKMMHVINSEINHYFCNVNIWK